MTFEDIGTIQAWSEGQCSAEELKKCQPKELQEFLLLLKHGMMRAFLSSGYCLWTRNIELCQLHGRDLEPDAKGPPPYCLPVLGAMTAHLKLGVALYCTKDTPEICMYTHFMRWRAIYRQRLGRDFEADGYAFPYIAPNGVIHHPKNPMSHDLVQDYINEFAQGAGISKIFTTHCLW
ncbi:hypothetical protein B0H13DRAFT_2352231 [Mycena leptocephala]|nr:hypothetical protein B0H13DRAFT_2352231 [Mycena leptocephala]